MLRVAVLQNSYETSNSPMKGLDPPCSPARWIPEHQCEHFFLNKATVIAEIRTICQMQPPFDLFVNLCDGAWDEDRAGMEVVHALERFNVPFTGARSHFFEPSKEIMKRVAVYCGVDVPAYVFAYDERAIEEAIERLQFPMIVKHYNGYGSIGMTKNSRCTNADELRIMAKKMIADFGGALIEEFIDGREFTVLVSENPDDPAGQPIAYDPIEVAFPPGETFKHFNMKWVDYESMYWKKVDDVQLATRLREASKRLFTGHKGNSYARMDLRMNDKGVVYFLEINPQCGIFYDPKEPGSADHILLKDAGGHRAFIHNIFQSAFNEHKRVSESKKLSVQYTKQVGFGLYAARDMDEGTVLYSGEEQPHYLVTTQHVKQRWAQDTKLMSWYYQYCWPINSHCAVMWSTEPADWKPVNHSCDPNAWLNGLDTVARRKIKKGEQITMDYGAFCGDFMEPFQCKCGSTHCRQRVTGQDHLLPSVQAMHGDHMSPYFLDLHARSKTHLITLSEPDRAGLRSGSAWSLGNRKGLATAVAAVALIAASLFARFQRRV